MPFYIDSGVWHETAISHSELQESEQDYELPFDRPADKESAHDGTLQAPNPDSRDPVVLTQSVDSPVDTSGIMCAPAVHIQLLHACASFQLNQRQRFSCSWKRSSSELAFRLQGC